MANRALGASANSLEAARPLIEILIKELRDSIVSRRVAILFLLCVGLIPLSVYVNQRSLDNFAEQQRLAHQEHQQLLERARQRHTDFGGKIPADELRVKIFPEAPPLAALAATTQSVAPAVVTLDLAGIRFDGEPAREAGEGPLPGPVDLLFIVQFVLSLAAVILTFNLICGEREAGTLRLVLANDVARGSVLFGKLASAVATLIVPFATGLGLALLALLGTVGGADLSAEDLVRVGAMAGVSVLYLTAFLSLGLWVSSLTARSLTAMVSLLILWVGLTALVPQAAGLLASTLDPAESPARLHERVLALRQEMRRQQLEELEVYAKRADYEEIRLEVAREYGEKLAEAEALEEEAFSERQARQRRLAHLLASVSPASAFSRAFQHLCGTAAVDAERFRRQLDLYRSEVDAVAFAGTYRDIFGEGLARGRIRLVDPQKLPTWRFAPAPLRQVLREVRGEVLLLLGFNALFFLGALVAFDGYDVR